MKANLVACYAEGRSSAATTHGHVLVSVDPRTVTTEQKAAFRAAMQTALSGGTLGGCEPLDWLTTTTPREWRLGTEKVIYHWEEPAGANPLRV